MEEVPLNDPKRQTDKGDVSIFGSDVEWKWGENEEDDDERNDGGCQRPHFVNRDDADLVRRRGRRTGKGVVERAMEGKQILCRVFVVLARGHTPRRRKRRRRRGKVEGKE